MVFTEISINLKLFFLIACIFHSSNDLFSQSQSNFVKDFYESKNEKFVESVFLELEKSNFFGNDSILFSAYIFNQNTELKIQPSGFLFVDLAKATGEIVLSQKLILENQMAFGEIPLTENIEPGKYVIIARTNNMELGSIANFFYKGILIGDIFDKSQENENIELEVYPEGNTLINGLENHIVIKSSKNNFGIPYSGEILDSNFNAITEFSTDSLGFTKLLFKPDGKKYFLKGFDSKIFDFPEIKDNGVIIRLANLDRQEKVVFELLKSKNNTVDSVYLAIKSFNNPKIWSKLSLNQPVTTISIPYKELDVGIHELTLFDESNKEILSRLFYIRKNYEKVTLKKSEYGNGDSLIIGLHAYSNVDFLFAKFNVSSKKEDSKRIDYTSYEDLHLDNLMNIPRAIWRTNNPIQLSLSIDNFLVTKKHMFLDYSEKISSLSDTTISYTVRIREKKTGELVRNEKIIVFSESLNNLKEVMTTNHLGEVSIIGLKHIGVSNFYFERISNVEKELQLELIMKSLESINSEYFKDLLFPSVNPLNLTFKDSTILETGDLSKSLNIYDLEEFTVKSTKIEESYQYINRPKSMIGLGKRIDISDDEISSDNPLKLVEKYGVNVIPTVNGYRAEIKGRSPTLAWNGMRLNPAALINYYSAHSVDQIDIYYNGAIVFFSKSVKKEMSNTNNINVVSIMGFANIEPKQGFYVSNFSLEQNKTLNLFLLRNMPYLINFEGMTEKGELFYNGIQ